MFFKCEVFACSYVRDLFILADDVLKYPISKIILEGPKEELDLTQNTH